MASENSYERARAYRSDERRQTADQPSISKSKAKRQAKKIIKSPLLLVIVITSIIGILGGYFLTKALCTFELNEYYVSGTIAAEKDYVIVDVSAHKEKREDAALKAGQEITMEEIYSSLGLVDKGASIKFMGVDVSDSVVVNYYYREDISHETKKTDKIDVSVPGVYYIEYTSSHFAFKNVKLIRTVIVTGVEIDG